MARRTTLEVEPSVSKSVKVVAIKKAISVKEVTDKLIRYALARVKDVFPERRSNRDNGK